MISETIYNIWVQSICVSLSEHAIEYSNLAYVAIKANKWLRLQKQLEKSKFRYNDQNIKRVASQRDLYIEYLVLVFVPNSYTHLGNISEGVDLFYKINA